MRDLIHQKKEGLQTLESIYQNPVELSVEKLSSTKRTELYSLFLSNLPLSLCLCVSLPLSVFFYLCAAPLPLFIPAPHSHTQGRHLNLKFMVPRIPGLQRILELLELSAQIVCISLHLKSDVFLIFSMKSVIWIYCSRFAFQHNNTIILHLN